MSPRHVFCLDEFHLDVCDSRTLQFAPSPSVSLYHVHRPSSTQSQLRRHRPEPSPCLYHRSRVPEPPIEVTNHPSPYFSLPHSRLRAIAHWSEVAPPVSHPTVDCYPPMPLCRYRGHACARHTPPTSLSPFYCLRTPSAPAPLSPAKPRHRHGRRRHWWP